MSPPSREEAGAPSQEIVIAAQELPLLAEEQPSVEEQAGSSGSSSSGSQPGTGGEGSQEAPAAWRTALVTPFAALKRALSRGGQPAEPQPQRLASTDPEAPQEGPSGSGSGSGSIADLEAATGAGAGDVEQQRSAEIEAKRGGSPKFARQGSRDQKVCLICLEALEPEDFESGRAISLECNCRGDLALRHKECAVKWAQVKGDRTCELCHAEVRNLPALPPRPQPLHDPDEAYGGEHVMLDLTPSYADLVFDCIRVTWVAMIVSILFFEMNLGAALWTGLVAGLAYSVMVKLMYRQHFAAMERLREQQQRAAGGGPGTHGQPPGGPPPPQQLQVVVAPM